MRNEDVKVGQFYWVDYEDSNDKNLSFHGPVRVLEICPNLCEPGIIAYQCFCGIYTKEDRFLEPISDEEVGLFYATEFSAWEEETPEMKAKHRALCSVQAMIAELTAIAKRLQA